MLGGVGAGVKGGRKQAGWEHRTPLTAPAPPCPCPALGRGWSGLRPAPCLWAWATGVAWGRREAPGAAGSRPHGGWSGCAAWGPPWGQRYRLWELGGGSGMVRLGHCSARIESPAEPSGSQGEAWIPDPRPVAKEVAKRGSPCGVRAAHTCTGACGGHRCGHLCVRGGHMQGKSRWRGHSLSAWLPRPPKALLPKLPRPPKVLDLLKGSVGATRLRDLHVPTRPSPLSRGSRT